MVDVGLPWGRPKARLVGLGLFEVAGICGKHGDVTAVETCPSGEACLGSPRRSPQPEPSGHLDELVEIASCRQRVGHPLRAAVQTLHPNVPLLALIQQYPDSRSLNQVGEIPADTSDTPASYQSPHLRTLNNR